MRLADNARIDLGANEDALQGTTGMVSMRAADMSDAASLVNASDYKV